MVLGASCPQIRALPLAGQATLADIHATARFCFEWVLCQGSQHAQGGYGGARGKPQFFVFTPYKSPAGPRRGARGAAKCLKKSCGALFINTEALGIFL